MPTHRGFNIYKPFGGIGYKVFGISGSFKTLAAAKKAINAEIRKSGVAGNAGKRGKKPTPKRKAKK